MTHARAAATEWLLLASCADREEERLGAQLEPLSHIALDTEGAGEFSNAEERPRPPIIPLGGQHE